MYKGECVCASGHNVWVLFGDIVGIKRKRTYPLDFQEIT